MIKRLLYIVLLLIFSAPMGSKAQSSAVQEEEVEGLGNVLGYFGKKLGKELGARLNLEATDTTEVIMVPTKVKVKFGPFTMERTEYRPKTVTKSSDTARKED